MATQSLASDWQSVFNVSLARLNARDKAKKKMSPRQMPIVQRGPLRRTETNLQEQALTDAANALAAIWRKSSRF